MQVDPQLLQSISIIVAICSIVLAFIIGVRSLRNASISRKASVFISYQTQAYDKQLLVDHIEFIGWSWKDYGEFMQKYGPQTNPEAYAKFLSILGFYEGMARLLKKKIIEIDLMPESMAILVVMFVEKIKPMSEQIVNGFGRAKGFELIKFLYDEVQKQQRLSEN
ncbi:MAG: hypothetical protein ACFFCB_06315 [Candidatus Odinarchaeota archaeon]